MKSCKREPRMSSTPNNKPDRARVLAISKTCRQVCFLHSIVCLRVRSRTRTHAHAQQQHTHTHTHTHTRTHTHFIDVGRAWRRVWRSGHAHQAVAINKHTKGCDARDEHVNPEIELEAFEEKGALEVFLAGFERAGLQGRLGAVASVCSRRTGTVEEREREGERERERERERESAGRVPGPAATLPR